MACHSFHPWKEHRLARKNLLGALESSSALALDSRSRIPMRQPCHDRETYTLGEVWCAKLARSRRRTYRGEVLDLLDNVLPNLLLSPRVVELSTLYLG